MQVPAIRQRVVSMLANVDAELAETLAADLGMDMPAPMPKVLARAPKPEVTTSPSLSLFARPGDGSIRGRKVAILMADGVDGAGAQALHAGLTARGAVPRFVGGRLGRVTSDSGDETFEIEVTLETTPAVLYDAVVIPDGKRAVVVLGNTGHALEFLKDQYRHCKPILALGAGTDLVENAGIAAKLADGSDDPGLLLDGDGDVKKSLARFEQAIAKHRHFAREMDPPQV